MGAVGREVEVCGEGERGEQLTNKYKFQETWET